MESFCVRHTELPHTSKLFADFLYHFDRVGDYYAYAPQEPGSYRDAALRIQYPAERRAGLIDALRTQNPDSANLRKLADPATFAVVTGQQVGLFSGPAYTIYKALTAVRLARRLSDEGIPAVPVFWLATEDHDFAEINHCWAFGADQRPVALRSGRSENGDRPVGDLPVGPEVPFHDLRRALATFEGGAEIADAVEASYAPGRTYGEAFAALLRKLLSAYDLVYIDPQNPALRQLAAPLLRQAVLQSSDLSNALLERNEQLSSAGYHAQVHFERETSLFFVLDQGRRVALKKKNGHYLARDRKYSADDLASMAEHLSPNALLRPVVQDWILPTIGYIGGPAELAYLAQSQTLYQRLLGRMPVAAARSTFTILDARANKLMERYRLPLSAFFHGEERLKDEIARVLAPPDVAEAVSRTQQSVERAVRELESTLTGFDPSLANAAARSRAKMLYQAHKIADKVSREALRRNARAQEEASYLYNQIFPNKHLQERFYTILPFLARHGTGLIDTLHDRVHLDCPDHLVLVA